MLDHKDIITSTLLDIEGLKNIVKFKYRYSKPKYPKPGAFYWVEETVDGKPNVGVWFTDSDCVMHRLDAKNLTALGDPDGDGSDGYLRVTEPDEFDDQKIYLVIGNFEKEDFIDSTGKRVFTITKKENKGLATVEDTVEYVSDSNNMIYNSNASDDWMTDHVGGVDVGLKREDLKNKTVSEILDMILFPTIQPTITEPDATISYNGDEKDGGVILVKVGTNLPAQSAFTGTQSRGYVEYVYSDGTRVKGADYAGVPSVATTISSGSFGGVSMEGTYTVTRKVTFAAGSTLKNNKGENAKVPAYAGGSISKTKVIHAVYPIYVNTTTIVAIEEQEIKDYIEGDVKFHVSIPEETASNKFEFHVPSHLTVSSVKQLNVLSGKYDGGVNYVQTGTTTHDGTTYNKFVRTTTATSIQGASKYLITLKRLD